MGFLSAIGSCYANILNFSGRARRKEYWYFTLFLFLLGIGLQVGLIAYLQADPSWILILQDEARLQAWLQQNEQILHQAGYAFAAYLVFLWLPHLAVTVRRLHDTNRSGFWILMPFVAAVASVVLMFLFVFLSVFSAEFMAVAVLCTMMPTVANIWFLVLLCLPGTHGNNRFGPDTIPNRKPKPPAHPAFAEQRSAKEQRAFEDERRAEIRELYQTRVLGNTQKV